MDYTQIKLLVWDLDETLWQGVLSEGEVILPQENKQLICDAVNAGVMCAICSKNDAAPVNDKLRSEGIKDLFVFNSINWSPKGERVKQIIQEMNLRAVNVMFIDDNPSNRAEVKNVCEGITSEDVDVIPLLRGFFAARNTKDTAHTRLKQYQILEKKRDFHASVGSNEEFLRKSNIQVSIKYDCENHLDRIVDLVARSNQLNFTKVRSTKEELEALISSQDVTCGYVEAYDAFGEYGIVGFFGISNNKLVHFTFSCRTLGMGVEQYVYQQLQKPELTIVGEVSSDPNSPIVTWINQKQKQNANERMGLRSGKMLIKGPCDMQQMFAYIAENKNIVTEFVYVNKNGVSIEQGNHTEHIVQSRLLSAEDKERLTKELPFGDADMYNTSVFDSDIDFVVLSLFTDPNLGMYREKQTGIIVAFGEYINDLTDSALWEKLINKEVFVANCNFTRENLESFADRFEYLGRIREEHIIENLEEIYKNFNNHANLILVLGSETEYVDNTKPAYNDRHIYHARLNSLVRAWASEKERVHLLDVNQIIEDPSEYTNNINHFTRAVYFRMSEKLVSIINNCGGHKLKQNGEIVAFLVHLTRKIRKIPIKIKAFISRFIKCD